MENQEPAYITISPTIEHIRFVVKSKDDFFKSEYIISRIEDDYIAFTLPTLDYTGKMLKSNTQNNSDDWRLFTLMDDRLVSGKFEIDEEESTEDELIVYFK